MKRTGSLNHIYRLVWSCVHEAWIAVSEIARGRGKTTRRRLVAAALSLGAVSAQADPLGGNVTAGSGSIAQSGALTTITQSSPTLSLSWQSFNIATTETVNFVQPSAAAIAVNRILDPHGTQILGRLNANGQVYLINPNGILFGQGAQVNVGGLVASTLDVNDASLGSDARSFSGPGTGAVVNEGTINAAAGGYVALLGNRVDNRGVISAQLGSVALGAGSAATLTFSGNSLVRMQVDQSVLNSVVDNGGLIRADGGTVLMNAGASDALLASVVNNTGVIEARTVENRGGTIVLLGGMSAGTTNVGGTLDASAPNGGDGGFIETSAAHVKVADATVTTAASMGLTGTWLIDPLDFTIAATGGDMSGAQVSAVLAGTNFEILSNDGSDDGAGDVNVNDVVSWNLNQLTLSAQNDININANLLGSGTASLLLQYGLGAPVSGNTSTVAIATGKVIDLPAGTTSFTTLVGSDGLPTNYTVITDLGADGSTTTTDLQGINGNTNLNYALGAHIDATATGGWNSGDGFTPLGNIRGIFDGLGHTITNLTIDQPGASLVGLFNYARADSVIQNVRLVGADVTGDVYVGALAGRSDGLVANIGATGAVTGNDYVGGLVGMLFGGSINDSSSAVAVIAARSDVGGLVGRAAYGLIERSHATGAVTGHARVGGLAGTALSESISNSSASGAVTGTDSIVGGLVGYLYGDLDNSSAAGVVIGVDYVGGLVGSSAFNFGSVTNSSATGNVFGSNYAGGLIGSTYGGVSASHADGDVVGNFGTGGLVGLARGRRAIITNSYATGDVSGYAAVGGLTGKHEDGSELNVHAFGAVTGTNNDIGGLIGYSYNSPISNGYATGDVSGVDRVGGLVGSSFYSNIESSHADGNVTANWKGGGLVGSTNAWVQGTHAHGTVTGYDSIGGLIGEAVGAGAGAVIGANDATGDVIGYSNVGGLIGLSDNNLVQSSHAYGAVTGSNYTGGLVGSSVGGSISGTFAYGVVTGGNTTGGLVGQAYGTDIGLSYSRSDVSGASFVGGLVGSQRNASTFESFTYGSVTGTGNDVGGLAGYVQNGSVTGSHAAGAVSGAEHVGGLIGDNDDSSIVSSYASGTVTGTIYIGGLVGSSEIGSITGSQAYGNVTGNYAGGLVGTTDGTIISDSFANGIVSGNSYVGGLVGIGRYGSVSGSHAIGAVTGIGHDVGGLIGFSVYSPIDGSYATGDVSGLQDVGGLVGRSISTIGNSHASGNVSGSYFVGGLVGDTFASVTASHASGNVTGDVGTGGLIGAALGGGDITSSYATGIVIGSHTVGGLIGYNDGDAIVTSYATGPVSGDSYVGGLAGFLNGGTLSGNHATGMVTASGSDVGGLIGHSTFGTIIDSYATGSVIGNSSAGGLIGFNHGTDFNPDYGVIRNSYATGDVTATSTAGGLVGFNFGGLIDNSHAGTGSVVTTGGEAGGLVGTQDNYGSSLARISNSFATGAVSGTQSVGGLAGISSYGSTISNSYATGSVIGTDGVGGLVGTNVGAIENSYAIGAATGAADGDVGGLVGWNSYLASTATITNSYASGFVSGSTDIGGLVGGTDANTRVVNSFWDTTQSGTAVSRGGTGMTTAQMRAMANFNTATPANGNVNPAWDFGATWILYEGRTAPLLRFFMTPITVTAIAATKSYDALAFSGGNGVTFSVTPNANLIGDTGFRGDSQGAVNAGTYVLASDAYSNQQGYAITFVDTTLTVNPAALTLSSGSVIKVYDGGLSALGVATATSGTLFGDDTLTGGSFAFTDKNVGNGNKAVTTSGVTVNDGNGGGNYTVSYANNTTSTITPAGLAVSGVTAAPTRVYDGTTVASLGGTAAVSGIGADAVSVSGTGSGAFANRNVGTAKPITVTGFTLSGADAGNYLLAQPGGLTANVTPANLTLSSGNVVKVYDGGLSSLGTATITSGALFGTDTLTGGTFAFTDKNAGTGTKTVTAGAVTVNDGNAGGNYNVSYANNTTSTITPAGLAVSGVTADDKVFDGTTTATLGGTASVNGFGTDQVGVGGIGSGVFDDQNIGPDVGVTVSGFSLTGADAGNYTVVQPGGLTANIMQAAQPRTLLDGVAQIVSEVLQSEEPAPEEPDLSSITAEAASVCNSVSATPGETSASAAGDCAVVNIGGTRGPRLRVMNGGMRLPSTMVKAEIE